MTDYERRKQILRQCKGNMPLHSQADGRMQRRGEGETTSAARGTFGMRLAISTVCFLCYALLYIGKVPLSSFQQEDIVRQITYQAEFQNLLEHP